MKLDPSITSDEIATILHQTAERLYGTERTAELSGAIESTAAAIATIATHELGLRDAAPEIGSPDGETAR